MKYVLPILGVLGLLLLSACLTKPTCVDPYVAIGKECCLDNDKNNVCDTASPTEKMTSVDELQRQVDLLLNATEQKANEVHSRIENASKENASATVNASDMNVSASNASTSTVASSNASNVSQPATGLPAGPYVFASAALKGTRDGVTLGIEDVTFVKKGDDWGELSSISFVVDNQGPVEIQPMLEVIVFDNDDGNYLPSDEVSTVEIVKPGRFLKRTMNMSLSLSRINATKTFRVLLTNGLVPESSTVVSVTEERVFNK
jgi:hypothetical protein